MKGLYIYRVFILTVWLSYGHSGQAQSPAGGAITFTAYQQPIVEILTSLSLQSSVNIAFSPDILPDKYATIEMHGDVATILRTLLRDTDIGFREQDGQYVLYRDDDVRPFDISGYITDVASGERLPAAHIYDMLTQTGSVSNNYGFFSLRIRGRSALIRISYLGYRSDTLRIYRDEVLSPMTVRLEPLAVFGVVVIDDHPDERGRITEMLMHTNVTERQIGESTVLGGEWDIQRYMESQPGVSTGTDGIGGMHIRGGNSDQNLILFDGVPIYHSTHAIGILSVFNPLMVREVDLYKGAFAARFAGRLSSVMDVKTREGNIHQWSARGAIGPATMNALVEGPVIREKVSVLVAARRFLPGFYLRTLSEREKARNGLSGETQYAFTDLNAKCNITLSPRDRLYISYYHGSDRYLDQTDKITSTPQQISDERFSRTLKWGNAVGALRWNRQFGHHVFANTTLTLSRFELQSFDYNEFVEQLAPQIEYRGFSSREFTSKILNAGVQYDIDHYLSSGHRMRYGIRYTVHVLSPKSVAFDDVTRINDFWINEGTLDDGLFTPLRLRAGEAGVYVEDELRFRSGTMLSTGLHLSAFDVREKIYWSLQPRAMLRMPFSENLFWHTSAGSMTQHLHLLTSSGIGLPTDLWVASTPSIKPQRSLQASTGVHWMIMPGITLSSEIYAKRMKNLITYQEGASFLIREGSVQSGILDAANWENKVTQGSGNAWGVENLLRFEGQLWNTEISYTYARASHKFEELNFGKSFPFRFDRRHSLTVSGGVQITPALRLNAGWHFGSGIPITLAESKILHPSSSPVFPQVEVLQFGERNAFRLPAYHRLDFGASYQWQGKGAAHSVHLDVYNVYDRRNVLYITLVREDGEFRNKQFTVLPVIPSLSYRIKI